MTEHESNKPAKPATDEPFGIDALDKLLEEGVLKGYARMDLALSLAGVFIVAVWGFFVFFRVTSIPFLFEDYANVVENQALHRIATISEGWNDDSIRPLTALSFAVDWTFGDGASALFHATNAFIHVLNSGLVFLLCRKLFDRGRVSEVMCLAPALVFMIHPAAMSSALYISDRGVLLGAFFALLTTSLYMGRSGNDSRAKPNDRYLASALAAFTAGWASHPALWALPLVLVSADLAINQRVRWTRIAPLAFLAAAFVVVHAATSYAANGSTVEVEGLWNRSSEFAAPIAQIFAPGVPLPVIQAATGSAAGLLLGLVCATAGCVLVFLGSPIGFAMVWSVVLFVSDGLFLQSGGGAVRGGSYFVLAGAVVALPAILTRIPLGVLRNAAGLAIAAAVFALSISGFATAVRWQDEESLLMRARAVCPECDALDDRLAALYIDRARGEASAARAVPGSSESISHAKASSEAFRKAIPFLETAVARTIGPDRWVDLGEARQQTGDPVGALEAYEHARREDPWSAEAAARLAGCLLDGAGPHPPRDTILRALDLYAVGQTSGELSAMDAARFAGLLTRIGDFESAAAVLDAAVEKTGTELVRDMQSKNAQSIAALTARETRLESLAGREKAYEEAMLLSLRGQFLQSNYRIHAYLKEQGFDEPMWILLAKNKASMGQLDDFLAEYRDSADVPAAAWANLRSAFAASGEAESAARISIEKN